MQHYRTEGATLYLEFDAPVKCWLIDHHSHTLYPESRQRMDDMGIGPVQVQFIPRARETALIFETATDAAAFIMATDFAEKIDEDLYSITQDIELKILARKLRVEGYLDEYVSDIDIPNASGRTICCWPCAKTNLGISPEIIENVVTLTAWMLISASNPGDFTLRGILGCVIRPDIRNWLEEKGIVGNLTEQFGLINLVFENEAIAEAFYDRWANDWTPPTPIPV